MQEINFDETAYMTLAEYLMFSSERSYLAVEKKMNTLGLGFRKGKTYKDLAKALEKALNPKNGLGKVEFELSMLECYLKKDVVKRKDDKSTNKLRCFERFPNYPVIEIKPENKRGEYLYYAINPGVFQYRKYLGNGYSEEASMSFKEMMRLISLPKEQAPRGTATLKKQMMLFEKEYPDVWDKAFKNVH